MTIETELPAVKVEWSEPPLTCPHIDKVVDSGALPEEVISELDKIRDINSQLRYGTWYLSAELAAKETEALGYLRAVGTLQDRIAGLEEVKHWYDEAMLAANQEGFGPGSAADAIRSISAELAVAESKLAEARADAGRKYGLGDRLRKTKGSSWQGHVVGFYSTSLTPIGYCIESEREPGSVQLYPEAALESVPDDDAIRSLSAARDGGANG